ncbi:MULTISPECIES: LysM peptidoglycan-binding domain-containing protein [Clostridium]|uniref:LysM peptidoglycan-binding domain-containing protein n=1 Tax=Clostridium TaxID=1485 RepID=UPI0008266F21|nr:MULTISPECIES: LysM peptidoglycan-binding domain-containing protein [Clostridium]PJI09261.1 LysM peptidoglycan-binding domain-containing protein [Clostridium sp. CT7]
MKKKILTLVLSAVIGTGLFIPSTIHAQTLSNTYTVAAGDSLWRISTKYNVTIDNLKKWNVLTSDVINVGQVLKLNLVHTVVSGDTLWLISKKYGTTVDSIMQKNNLTTTTLNIGQELLIEGIVYGTQTPPVTPVVPSVTTVNYKVVAGDNLWTIAQKYKTTEDAIMKSNMLLSDAIVPTQTLTIPVNSTEIVKPVGITMMKARVNDNFGDIYTWENAMRLWTVGTEGTLRDLATNKTFKIKYMEGSNHSDVEPLTLADTDVMKSLYGSWSWANDHKRPMVLYFTKNGVNYQMAVSLTGMPHGVETITDNGFDGHTDMYFYNSLGHSNPVIDPVHQANVLKANGQ